MRHSDRFAPAHVAVVTDSAAGLTAAEAVAAGIVVVPLVVTIDGEARPDSPEALGAILAAAADGRTVTTSQPAPGAFAAAYRTAADAGASEVVSIHLAGSLSGTVHAASVAARDAPVPVHVVDSGTAGAALAGIVLDVAAVARQGAQPRGMGLRLRRLSRPMPEVAGSELAAQAVAAARRTRSWVVVESLDHLRRGGRLGRTASAVGTALGMRPILELRGSGLELVALGRGRSGARQRLVRLVAAAAGGAAGQLADLAAGAWVEVAVQGAGQVGEATGPGDDGAIIEAVRVAVGGAVAGGGAVPGGSGVPGGGAVPGGVSADGDAPAQQVVAVRPLPGVLAAHLGPGAVAASVAVRRC